MIQPKLWLIERQLNAQSPARRLEAVRKLRQVENAAVFGLLGKALADEDISVRCEAAQALGDDLDSRVVPLLVRALNDSAEAVQEAAIQSLEKIGDSAAVDALVHSFFHGSHTVSWRAAHALRALHWRPTSPEEQVQWAVANGDINLLPGFGSAAIKPLAGMLASVPFEQRVAVVEALAAIPDRAVQQPLLEALRDDNAAVRTAAAAALGDFPDAATVSALVHALKDSEHNVREAAAIALGKAGDPLAVEPLIGLLGDKCWEVRVAVTEALGRLGDARAFQPVAAQMQDQDEAVRQSAIEAVGSVGDDSILEKLVFTLVDDNNRVRGAAERALRKLCPEWESSNQVKRMLPKIQGELKNRQANTQFAASRLLRRVGGSEVTDLGMAEIAQTPTLAATDKRTFCSSAIISELVGDADAALRVAAEQAAVATGQSPQPAVAPPAGERPALAEVAIFSTQGEAFHVWPAEAARKRWRVLQSITQHARRLTQEIKLGEFDRLQLDGETERVVVKASESGVAFVRTGMPDPGTSAAYPGVLNLRPVAVSEEVKENITRWLRESASIRGVLLRSVRFADKTFACDVDSQLYPPAALERMYECVVELFQTFKQSAPVQLSWIFSRTAVHFARRSDGALLGAFTQVKAGDQGRTELTELFEEFRRL